MIVRSFENAFELVDYTEEINIIPNSWGTINNLGIFTTESVAEHTVTFEVRELEGALIVDRVRGDRANVNKGFTRELHSFAVPHFPLDDYISPSDLQGKRAYGPSQTAAETLAAVRARKMESLRMKHAWTLEFARAYAITTGNIYAPNGTVVLNWYTEFGKTRDQVDFTFGTSTTDVMSKIEEVIATIQDNAAGSVAFSGIVILTSPEFFSKLIAHPSIKTAYTYYASTSEPLRRRQAPNGSATALHREFDFGGVKFIEMRDQYEGQRLIPAGEAYAVPTGTDAFKTFFSPAERFELVNTLGEQLYMFETRDQKGSKIEIETEQNMVNMLGRPDLVVRMFSSN